MYEFYNFDIVCLQYIEDCRYTQFDFQSVYPLSIALCSVDCIDLQSAVHMRQNITFLRALRLILEELCSDDSSFKNVEN